MLPGETVREERRGKDRERTWEIEQRARVSSPSPADFEPAGARTRSDYRRRDLKDQRALYIPRTDEVGRGWLGNARVEFAENSFGLGGGAPLPVVGIDPTLGSTKIGQAN